MDLSARIVQQEPTAFRECDALTADQEAFLWIAHPLAHSVRLESIQLTREAFKGAVGTVLQDLIMPKSDRARATCVLEALLIQTMDRSAFKIAYLVRITPTRAHWDPKNALSAMLGRSVVRERVFALFAIWGLLRLALDRRANGV